MGRPVHSTLSIQRELHSDLSSQAFCFSIHHGQSFLQSKNSVNTPLQNPQNDDEETPSPTKNTITPAIELTTNYLAMLTTSEPPVTPSNPLQYPRVNIIINQSRRGDFTKSNRSELEGLMHGKSLTIVPREEAQEHRVYRMRFEDSVKFEGQPNEYRKSRLIRQGYKYHSHGLFTQAPTIQRSSQRLLMCLVPTLCHISLNFGIYQRDENQAHNQSETPVTGKHFARPPPELNLPRE